MNNFDSSMSEDNDDEDSKPAAITINDLMKEIYEMKKEKAKSDEVFKKELKEQRKQLSLQDVEYQSQLKIQQIKYQALSEENEQLANDLRDAKERETTNIGKLFMESPMPQHKDKRSKQLTSGTKRTTMSTEEFDKKEQARITAMKGELETDTEDEEYDNDGESPNKILKTKVGKSTLSPGLQKLQVAATYETPRKVNPKVTFDRSNEEESYTVASKHPGGRKKPPGKDV